MNRTFSSALVIAALFALNGCGSDAAASSMDPSDSGTGDAAPLADGGNVVDGSGMDGAIDAAPGAPGVRFVGRIDTSDDGGATRFEWPGVSLHANFTGASVAMDLNDSDASEFAVFVDGMEQTKVVATPGRKSYPLASGLSSGMHELEVWKRTESYVGLSEFYGLTFDPAGALLAPPAPLAHRIEIIGDSITVGYGNEGMPGCTFSDETENNYLAYGSVAARAVGAEISTVAWSGLGVYRNYNDVGASAMPLPYYYDDALATVPMPWNFSLFTPDLVVINLGTNDSSTHGDPGEPYIDAYVAFIKHVRTNYPNAWVICIDSNSTVTSDVAEVVSTMKTAGDAKIESFALTGQNGLGCDGHPNTASDALMGASLATEIKRVMSW